MARLPEELATKGTHDFEHNAHNESMDLHSSREMMANLFNEYYYVYVLQSLKDGKKYTGYTKNLPSRFEAHQNGEIPSTKDRKPFKLIYFEGCLNQQDATKREKYLPRGINRRFNAWRYSTG